MILFSSDNGPSTDRGGVDGEFFNSAGGLRGLKGSLYEGGIREPMIAWWPGHVKAGAVTELPSAQYDVAATLCDLTGTSMTEMTDGISFLPTLLGRPDEQKMHDYLYWEFPAKNGSQAVTQGDWKIVRFQINNNPDTPWELYNLKNDPAESHNLAAKHPARVARMAAMAKEAHWQPQVREFEFLHSKTAPQAAKNRSEE